MDLNHCRSASISEIRAIGTPQILAAAADMSSKTGSGSVSSTAKPCSVCKRSVSAVLTSDRKVKLEK